MVQRQETHYPQQVSHGKQLSRLVYIPAIAHTISPLQMEMAQYSERVNAKLDP